MIGQWYVLLLPRSNFRQKTNLIGQVVKALQSSPATNLESVNKFMSEICNSYNMNSSFMKSILLAEDGGLIRTLVALTKVKSVSAEAIKLLDEVRFANRATNTNLRLYSKSLWPTKRTKSFLAKFQNTSSKREKSFLKCLSLTPWAKY